MIGFNTLLRDEGVDPKVVKLARHQQHKPGRPTPYQLWRAKDGSFERYQQIQSRTGIFKGAQMLSAFVATPMNETLFVGLYRINGVGKTPTGMRCPVSDENVGGVDF